MAIAKILIVEDEMIAAMNLAGDLEDMGYEIVETATSGEEALQFAAQLQPDLILMDINLPGSIDGIEAATEIRQRFNIPVVFLTSYSNDETLQRAGQAGSFGYLLKPYKTPEVRASIEIALSKYQEEISLAEALTKAESNSQIQWQYLAIAAHEMRTPLSVIQLAKDLLEAGQGKLPPEKSAKYFERIHKSIALMSQSIDNALAIGQLEAGKLTHNPIPLDLDVFCGELVDELRARTQSISNIIYQIQPDPIKERFMPALDRNILQQILSNLLSNAIKYSPQGGEVILSVTCSPSHVKFEVQDRGIGIPTEYLEKLFQRFERANNVGKIKGTGLGLNIVKNLVDLHRGEISVESEIDIGTKFIVTLPCGKGVLFTGMTSSSPMQDG
jgi:signal transduction histidine kinase